MIQTSTPGLLLLHAYGETNEQQKDLIAKKLANDPCLQDELAYLMSTKKMLSCKMRSPSETSVRIIMEHSNKTEKFQEI